jgi:hypothetical protein
MANIVSWNGSSFTVPEEGEENWAGVTKVDGLLRSLATNGLQKTGGNFTLSADIDFGGTAGLKSTYFKSRSSNISTAGIVRLANAESIGWRNAANGGNVLLSVDSSDRLTFAGTVILSSGGIVQVAAGGTGLASYSAGDILYATGATTLAKLAIGTANKVLVSDGSAPGYALIVNANIDAAAAIARSKVASGSADHVLINDAGGAMSSEATLSKVRGGAGADMSSVTFPSSGTIATLAGSQTFSNKKFSDFLEAAEVATPSTPGSGYGRLYPKSDGKWYTLNDDGTETQLGAGSGGINYLAANPDFESGTTGWATYADAAGTSPVDGTGGSPTTTLTRSTSSPLRGTANGLITKDAANRQGEGVSFDFSIASADKAKMLNVSFEYAGSANLAVGDSSDVRVWVYDVTNSALIPVTPYTIQGGTGYTWKFNGQFQSASNSTSYRLILHIATTNASAWTMQIDNFVVGPTIQIIGAPIGDWTSFTPTGNMTTNVTYTGFWRRVGDSMHIRARLAFSGATDATILSVNLPSGYTVDSAKNSK